MKRKQSLAPMGLVVLGGLMVVVALAIPVVLPAVSPGTTPSAQPAEAGGAPAEGSPPRVSVGDAKAAYDLRQAVFVDVRDRMFYEEAHIPGALSIPLDELEERLGELDPANWIITYCT